MLGGLRVEGVLGAWGVGSWVCFSEYGAEILDISGFWVCGESDLRVRLT